MVANLEPVVFAVDADSRRAVATAARRGNVRRVATGVYTVDVTTPIDRLVPERLHEIIGLVRPGAHLCGRTAALGGLPTADGDVFVVHSALRPVSLAGGVTVRSAPGTLGLESDLRLPGGITMSSEARLALENLVPSRSRDGRLPRTLGRAELKEWIDRRTAEAGESWAEDLLRDAETVSAQLGLESEFALLRDLVGAAPATQEAEVEADPPPPPAPREDFDARVVARFDALLEALSATEPELLQSPTSTAPVAAFVAAYFSNFIEGTAFGYGEASRIVFGGAQPKGRKADARDLRATFAVCNDIAEMGIRPDSFEDLVEILRRRHCAVMTGNPNWRPGAFKERPHRIGTTVFVRSDRVTGTLREAFERYQALSDPFGRAAFLHYAVAAVHPFEDGNGRTARLMMNSELVACGLSRIVIPTVYRNTYLAALQRLKRSSGSASYIKMLRFAWRYTSLLDCSSLESAKRDLTETNAFVDPTFAEIDGVPLIFPSPRDKPRG